MIVEDVALDIPNGKKLSGNIYLLTTISTTSYFKLEDVVLTN
jgi:hypothetical protein